MRPAACGLLLAPCSLLLDNSYLATVSSCLTRNLLLNRQVRVQPVDRSEPWPAAATASVRGTAHRRAGQASVLRSLSEGAEGRARERGEWLEETGRGVHRAGAEVSQARRGRAQDDGSVSKCSDSRFICCFNRSESSCARLTSSSCQSTTSICLVLHFIPGRLLRDGLRVLSHHRGCAGGDHSEGQESRSGGADVDARALLEVCDWRLAQRWAAAGDVWEVRLAPCCLVLGACSLLLAACSFPRVTFSPCLSATCRSAPPGLAAHATVIGRPKTSRLRVGMIRSGLTRTGTRLATRAILTRRMSSIARSMCTGSSVSAVFRLPFVGSFVSLCSFARVLWTGSACWQSGSKQSETLARGRCSRYRRPGRTSFQKASSMPASSWAQRAWHNCRALRRRRGYPRQRMRICRGV